MVSRRSTFYHNLNDWPNYGFREIFDKLILPVGINFAKRKLKWSQEFLKVLGLYCTFNNLFF